MARTVRLFIVITPDPRIIILANSEVSPMKCRFFLSALCIAVMTGILAAQAPKKWTPPRTPDGQPDIQGIWSFATITPLQRPADLAGKEFFTPKEAEAYEKATRER